MTRRPSRPPARPTRGSAAHETRHLLVVLGAVLALTGGVIGCAPSAEVPGGEAPAAGPAEAAAPPAYQPANLDPAAVAFAEPIEEAQGAAVWYAQPAFAAEIELVFGGQRVFAGTMWTTPEVGRARLEIEDGSVAIFDGERAWVAPEGSTFENARFHVLTWPYFLALPMKLRDPGTRLEPGDPQDLGGERYDTARLTFSSGVGDSPDDWYVLYRDLETHRLAAARFIVTYGKSKDAAEKHPEVIFYDDWTDVDGVSIPTHWTIHAYGVDGVGDLLAEITLENPRFATPPEGAFDKPEGAKEAPMPGPAA